MNNRQNCKAMWSRWNARDYLNEYFNPLGPDAKATTAWLIRELSAFKGRPTETVLEFGSGPSLIGVVGVTPYARQIHVADYLAQNRREIRSWLGKAPKSFNHREIIAFVLRLEGIEPTQSRISKRSHELRQKITRVLPCDAGFEIPIPGRKQRYPLVITLYCADSATASKRVWRKYMINILRLVAPYGTILVAALRKCRCYRVGIQEFPSADIDERDLKTVLIENGFPVERIRIQLAELGGERERILKSRFCARTKRRIADKSRPTHFMGQSATVVTLDPKFVAGVLSGIVATAAFVLYLRATFRGPTKPNRATWWILTVVGLMLAGSYHSLGARHTIWLAVSYALCPLVTAIVSLKHGEGGWTQFDRACLIVAGISAVLWWLCHSPLVALLINLFIDFVGLLPTIRKSYERPASENRIAWLIAFLASVLNLFAVERWEFAIAVYPLYMALGNGVIAVLLYRRREEPVVSTKADGES